jgi:hypothetical protein
MASRVDIISLRIKMIDIKKRNAHAEAVFGVDWGEP